MSTGLTLAEAQARYAAYLTAEEKILAGQSYEIKGRTLTRANLTEVRNGLSYWENMCNRLAGTRGAKVTSIIPMD
jgi:hypothetical protein